jgi:hypothetical protein
LGDCCRHTGNIQFLATAKGFRVYVTGTRILTPSYAENHMWTVAWIGFPATDFPKAFQAKAVGTAFVGSQSMADIQDGGSGLWQYMDADPRQGVYTKVDTHKVCALLASKYHRSPPKTVYVTSISAAETDVWGNVKFDPTKFHSSIGTLSINQQHNLHNTTKCGFKYHMGNGNVTFPKKNRWRVQYLGFTVIDCIVSDWTAYSPCTKTCVGGTQFRTRKVIQTPLRGGKACPPHEPGYYRQSRQCHMNDCVGKGKKQLCGGTTAKGHTDWRAYGTRGLVLEVGTAFCRFESATQYAVSVVGDTGHWVVQGSNAIAEASNARFKVIVYPRGGAGGSGATAAALVRVAKKNDWRLSWIGATGDNTGITDAHATGWRQAFWKDNAAAASAAAAASTSMSSSHHAAAARRTDYTLPHVLVADVDTTESKFFDKKAYPARPRLFTSLRGFTNQWRTQGSHVVYSPTRTSFRVYVQYDEAITPAQASAFKWQVAWIGTDSEHSGSSSSDWKDTKMLADAVPGGQGGRQGRGALGHLPAGVFIDVDTSAKGYHVNPTYVSALETPKSDWHPMGSAAAMYDPTQTSFRVYIATASIPSQMAAVAGNQFWDAALYAKDHSWTVNYIGYQGQSELCGDTTGAGFSTWKKFGSLGLYLDVNTMYCDFKKTPQYLTTVNGVNKSPLFGFMKGTTVMARSAKDSFRVIVYYPALTGYNLVQYATKYKWHLSWLADSGSSGGCTNPGHTGWKQAAVGWDGKKGSAWTRKALFVDVDTSPWGFVQAPRYFTMLHGAKDHYKTQGSNIVYFPTATGFRVYVVSNDSPVTAAQAEAKKWAISWMGGCGVWRVWSGVWSGV